VDYIAGPSRPFSSRRSKPCSKAKINYGNNACDCFRGPYFRPKPGSHRRPQRKTVDFFQNELIFRPVSRSSSAEDWGPGPRAQFRQKRAFAGQGRECEKHSPRPAVASDFQSNFRGFSFQSLTESEKEIQFHGEPNDPRRKNEARPANRRRGSALVLTRPSPQLLSKETRNRSSLSYSASR